MFCGHPELGMVKKDIKRASVWDFRVVAGRANPNKRQDEATMVPIQNKLNMFRQYDQVK